MRSFLPFTLADHHRAPVGVHVVQVQPDQLHAPHAGAVQRFHHGAVADAGGRAQVGLGQHGLRLLIGQHVLGQAAFQPGKLQVAGRVVQDVVLSRQPFEEGAQWRDAGVLAARGERLAVLLPVQEQVSLVALQDRLGDVLRPVQAAFLAPQQEVADIGVAALDGGRRVVLLGLPHQQSVEHGRR